VRVNKKVVTGSARGTRKFERGGVHGTRKVERGGDLRYHKVRGALGCKSSVHVINFCSSTISKSGEDTNYKTPQHVVLSIFRLRPLSYVLRSH
jgi:hypothetical protein